MFLPNGLRILGWKNTNRFDVIDDTKDMIFNAEKISSHEYFNRDAETYFQWGVPGVSARKKAYMAVLQ